MGNKSRKSPGGHGQRTPPPPHGRSARGRNNNNCDESNDVEGHDNQMDEEGDGDDLEGQEEIPATVSHGFWLRRYSWLHASEQRGLSGTTTATTSKQQRRKKRRLLARWTNLIRHNFGGSTGDHNGLGSSSATPNPRSGAQSAPLITTSGHHSPPRSAKRSARHDDDQEDPRARHRYGLCGWHTTSSQAASPSRPTSESANVASLRAPEQRPSRKLTGWLLKSISSSASALPAGDASNEPPASSPYRRLARALRPTSRDNQHQVATDARPSEGQPKQPTGLLANLFVSPRLRRKAERRAESAGRADDHQQLQPADGKHRGDDGDKRKRDDRPPEISERGASVVGVVLNCAADKGAADVAFGDDSASSLSRRQFKVLPSDTIEPVLNYANESARPTTTTRTTFASSASSSNDNHRLGSSSGAAGPGSQRSVAPNDQHHHGDLHQAGSRAAPNQKRFNLERDKHRQSTSNCLNEQVDSSSAPSPCPSSSSSSSSSSTSLSASSSPPSSQQGHRHRHRRRHRRGHRRRHSLTRVGPQSVTVAASSSPPGLTGPNQDAKKEEAERNDDDDDNDDQHQVVAAGCDKPDPRDDHQQRPDSAGGVQFAWPGSEGQRPETVTNFLTLIQAHASSSSSFGSSSICCHNQAAQADEVEATDEGQHEIDSQLHYGRHVCEHSGAKVAPTGASQPASEFDRLPIDCRQCLELQKVDQMIGANQENEIKVNVSEHDENNNDNTDKMQVDRLPPPADDHDGQRASSQPAEGADRREQRLDELCHHLDESGHGERSAATNKTASIQQTSGVLNLRSNFKKLVKRQQSVDSYRMARDLKNKLRRQQEGRNKHQSNEAIRLGAQPTQPGASTGRKYSMRTLDDDDDDDVAHAGDQDADGAAVKGKRKVRMLERLRKEHLKDKEQAGLVAPALKICIDPYAEPGSFTLPGSEQADKAKKSPDSSGAKTNKTPTKQKGPQGGPTPPKTLSLMPTSGLGFMGSGFSGSITPTYPTHHLPSPKYVSPALMEKKYSNASTISSSFGAEISLAMNSSAANNNNNNQPTSIKQPGNNGTSPGNLAQAPSTNQSDTESSLAGSVTPSRSVFSGSNRPSVQISTGGGGVHVGHQDGEQVADSTSLAQQLQQQQQQALLKAQQQEAERRANLAEHIYDNRCGLGEDMKFLASLPELCDITFLVGETREPVCAVKWVLAARSRVFHKILFGNRLHQQRAIIEGRASAMVATETAGDHDDHSAVDSEAADRRGSSPRPGLVARNWVGAVKSSSPVSRSSSPNQQRQQQQHHHQWSVTSDASGYNNPTGQGGGRSSAMSGSGAGPDQPAGGTRSGRVSVISNGRESGVSQLSQGSQQPLIIGPGQMATPAPKRSKKSSLRAGQYDQAAGGATQTHHHHGGASRLRSMFMNKRASDPSIKHNNQTISAHGAHSNLAAATAGALSSSPTNAGATNYSNHNHNNNNSNQNYLDKMSSSQMSTTMIIEEFEPDVFRQLIEYIHTGCVLLQARTLLGLLNAADYYGLEQLRKACLRFVSCCITVDTVCSLLSTAERYIQYKCTKSIVQKVLEFVDSHANEIFKLNAFGLLPEHVVRLILARDGLQADEFVKYNGVYTWCEHYCRSYELTNLADVMRNFLDLIHLYKIPTNILLSEIYPTHVVPDHIFLSALAYQADPENFEPQVARPRRMTLPNPTIYNKDMDDDDDDQDQDGEARPPTQSPTRRTTADAAATAAAAAATDGHSQRAITFDQATSAKSGRRGTGASARERLQTQRSSGILGSKTSGSSKTFRKGSIAQASISGVMKLSHKLSIRKRHSSNVNADEARRRGSGTSTATTSMATGGRYQQRQASQMSSGSKSTVSKQSSLAQSNCSSADPLQVGQQILSAYLSAQRQRELEEREQKEREERERRAKEEAARRAAGILDPIEAPSEQRQPIVKTPSSSRKSFRDFKHISRRLFMRHSSNKVLQQQSSSISSGGGAGDHRSSADKMSEYVAPPPPGGATTGSPSAAASERRRYLLKIKRSETVFESSTTTTMTTSTAGPLRLSHQLSSNIK